MATRPQSPRAAAGDDPPAAAGPDDSTAQALARSREIRQKGNRQIQAVRERAAARRRRGGPGPRSRPTAPDQAARFLDVGQEIERSRQARARLAEPAGELVQTEEAVARIHDEMAGRDSPRAAAYRRAADDARRAARRAREIQRNAAGSGPPVNRSPVGG